MLKTRETTVGDAVKKKSMTTIGLQLVTMILVLVIANVAKAYTVTTPTVATPKWVVAIACGWTYSMVLKNDGTVAAWGDNDHGETSVPIGLTGVISIAAGRHHALALKNDSTVVAWGNNNYGQTIVPGGLTEVISIAAGQDQSLALKKDGTVVAWGDNSHGKATVPSGLYDVTAIAAGGDYSMALKKDGTVVAWGDNEFGQAAVAAGLTGVVAIAAGSLYAVALKNDGTVVAWGNNQFGQAVVPTGLTGVIAIAAGTSHAVALKNDGTIVAWGFNQNGQAPAPSAFSGEAAISVAAGTFQTLALKNDGTVASWGTLLPDQANVLNSLFAIPHGTITCTSPVNSGEDSLCTITPDPGYHLGSLTVNGTDKLDEVTGTNIKMFTIPQIQADQTVSGLFVADFLQSAIKVTKQINFTDFELSLNDVHTNGVMQPISSPTWSISDQTMATINGNTLTAEKNGLVQITGEVGGKAATKALFLLPDPYSPDLPFEGLNNSSAQADHMAQNEVWQGQLLANDTDWYQIDLAQDTLTGIAYLSTSPTADVQIEVMDGEGNIMTIATSTNGVSKSIPCRLKAGSNFVRLSSVGDIDQDEFYYLAWSSWPDDVGGMEDEPNNDIGLATPLTVGVWRKGLLPAGDLDWYRFTLLAPALAKVVLATDSSLAVYRLTLYKGSEDYPIGGTTTKSGKPIALSVGLAAGEYLMKVEPNGNADPQAFYTLMMNAGEVAGLEIEPNNTLASANGLNNATPIQGHIYAEIDQDLFGFAMTTKATVTINFSLDSTITADYVIELLNASGTIIPGTTKTFINGTEGFIKNTLVPGTYFLRVKSGGEIDSWAIYTVSLTTTGQVTAVAKLATLQVTAASNVLSINQSLPLSVTAVYSDASGQVVTDQATFLSSDPTVLSVDANGQVTGLKEGRATITIAYQDKATPLSFTVGNPQTVEKQGHGNLIIVAGGTLLESDSLQQATLYVSELAYQKFQARNFTVDDIYFMTQTAFHDLNGDGYDDGIVDDLTPTKEEVSAAITGWAKDQVSSGPLYVYLTDHGAPQQFQVASGQILTAAQLNVALDQFQEATGRPVVVIIEACYSGSFVTQLTSSTYERLILSSTDAKNPGYLSTDGSTSYSSFLLTNLYKGKSILDSLNQAKADLTAIGLPYKKMAPQMAGSQTLQGVKVGGDFVLAGVFPAWGGLPASQAIGAGSLMLNTQVTALMGGLSVWAVIVPPDYTPPTVSGDFVSTVDELPKVVLVDEDPSTKIMDGLFQGSYNFTKNGDYTVIFYAKDSEKNLIKSAPVTITVSGGAEASTTTTTMTTETTTTVTTSSTTTTSSTVPTTTIPGSSTTSIEISTTTTTAVPATTTTTIVPVTTTTTIPYGTDTTFTLSVTKDWSLLSSTIGFQVATAFSDNAIFTSVWKWTDNGGQVAAKTWSVYLPDGDGGATYAQSKGFLTLTEIKSGEGFWVNAMQAGEVKITGTPNYGALALTKGWNLVGLKGQGEVSPSTIGNVVSVWKWADNTWSVYLPDDNGGQAYADGKGFNQLTTIKPGEGFWVNKQEI